MQFFASVVMVRSSKYGTMLLYTQWLHPVCQGLSHSCSLLTKTCFTTLATQESIELGVKVLSSCMVTSWITGSWKDLGWKGSQRASLHSLPWQGLFHWARLFTMGLVPAQAWLVVRGVEAAEGTDLEVDVEILVCLSGMKKPWRREDQCLAPHGGAAQGEHSQESRDAHGHNSPEKVLEKFSFQHPEGQKCLSKPLWNRTISLCLSPCCRRGSLHQQMNQQQFNVFNFWSELAWSEC